MKKKSLLKDVKNLKEFEEELKNLKKKDDEFKKDIMNNPLFLEEIERVKNSPVSVRYMKYGEDKNKIYCPLCGVEEVKDYDFLETHTCKKEDLDKGLKGYKKEGFANYFNLKALYSPYSDIILPVRIRIERFIDEEELTLEDEDFDALKNPKFEMNIKIIYDEVLAYTEKHQLRVLNSNKRISKNISTISGVVYSGNFNYLNYEYIGGVEEIKKNLCDGFIKAIYKDKEIDSYPYKMAVGNYHQDELMKKAKKSKNNKIGKNIINFDVDFSKIKKDLEGQNYMCIKKISEVGEREEHLLYCNNCKDSNIVSSIKSDNYSSYTNPDTNEDNLICPNCQNEKRYTDPNVLRYRDNHGSSLSFLHTGITEKNFYYELIFRIYPKFNTEISSKESVMTGYSIRIEHLSIADTNSKEVKNYIPVDDKFRAEPFINLENIKEEDYLFKAKRKSDPMPSLNNVNLLNEKRYLSDIRSSNIKYSGLDEIYLNLKNDKINLFNYSNLNTEIYLADDKAYINTWFKYPKIERAIKDPLYFEMISLRGAHHFVNYPYSVFNRDNNDNNLFSIRKSTLGIAKKIYSLKDNFEENYKRPILSTGLLELLSRIDKAYIEKDEVVQHEDIFKALEFFLMAYKEQNDVDFDIYTLFTPIGYSAFHPMSVSIENLLTIYEDYNIDINRSIKYLDSVFYNQCIFPREAIQLWIDYLRMAKHLEYEDRKEILFPHSLKKEHDIASFAFRKIKDEIANKEFEETMEKLKDYAYEGDKMSVVLPETTKDLIREGKLLSHCVGSYVLKVNKDNPILFIRNNNDIKAPFYTMEIKDNNIVQVRGYANRLPDNKIKAFVEEYAKVKKLDVLI